MEEFNGSECCAIMLDFNFPAMEWTVYATNGGKKNILRWAA